MKTKHTKEKLTKAQEERLRKEIATILVGYDKRYTVASISILLDKILFVLAEELAKQKTRKYSKDDLSKNSIAK